MTGVSVCLVDDEVDEVRAGAVGVTAPEPGDGDGEFADMTVGRVKRTSRGQTARQRTEADEF